eukprot:6889339-Prymnesium_polylepis.1
MEQSQPMVSLSKKMKRIRPPDEERVCLQKGVKMNSEFADLFGSDSEDDHKPDTTVQPASTGDAQ